VQVRAGFIGFSEQRTSSIVSAIEGASDTVIEPVALRDDWTGKGAGGIGSVFLNREIDDQELNRWLDAIRDDSVDIPIVLVYGSEPDGKSYMLSNRFDCWLFSEKDRLERTLTAADIGRALADGEPDPAFERRLFEVSLSAGPCSTGS
jgi:hypothetical protein